MDSTEGSSGSNSSVGYAQLQASKGCDIDYCKGDASRPPYAQDRRYAVVISIEEDPNCCEYTCVLQFLLKCFHMVGEEVGSQCFSECTSVEQFDCNLRGRCYEGLTDNPDQSDLPAL